MQNKTKFHHLKTVFFYLCFGIVFMVLFSSCSVVKQPKTKWKLSACDTVELPFSGLHLVHTFYMPEYNTQVNTYFIYYPEVGHHGFIFCIDSIKPTVIFPVKTLIQNYFIEDTNTFIYQSSVSNLSKNNFLKRVNREGIVLDTLYFGFMGTLFGDTLNVCSTSTVISPPLNKTGSTHYYYSHISYPKFYHSMRDVDARRRVLQRCPYVQKIAISKDSVTLTKQKYTHYPKAFFLEKASYLSWLPHVVFNKNSDIITTYSYIDSLFVTHANDNSQKHFSMKSRYKTKPIEPFDGTQRLDNVYCNEYSCRNISYGLLKYDSYQDCYYQIVSKPMPYENKDGTFNSPADKLWSLIIIDSDYKQVGEIKMPKYLDKHKIMITPQGVAIQHKKLSEKKGTTVYVIYKFKKR